MVRCVGWGFALSLACAMTPACSDGGASSDGGQGAGHGGGGGAAGVSAGAGGTGAGSGGTSGGGIGGTNGGSPGGMSGGLGGMNGADSGSDPVDGGTTPDDGDPGGVVGEPDDEISDLFDQAELRTYNLIIAQPDLDTLNASPRAEQYVQGMVEIDGEQVGPVGIRYKGSVGAFQPPCTGFVGEKAGKCSIKVAFDYLDDDARYRGVKKLNFHSMNADRSQLRERLVYAMFRENGIAAPRAVHARVLINGQLEGLFALIEQIDGRFTRSRFTEGGKGNLYKEVWPMHDDPAVYLNALESNRDEMPSADRVLAFKAAIEQGAASAEAWIDRDYFLRYLAVDRVTINDDGMMHWWCTPLGQGNNPGGIGNHNYYWYEAQSAQRFWLIPWDTDMALAANAQVLITPEWRTAGACTCDGGFGFASRAPVCDPLISTWSGWTDDYEAAIDAFIAGPFSEANVNAKLDAWTAQIADVVMESEGLNGAPLFAEWQAAAESLRAVVDGARSYRGSQY